MAIAMTLSQYLYGKRINYTSVSHRHCGTAINSASAAHVPAGQVSKAVILQSWDGDYLMAAVPANRRLLLDEVNKITGKQYQLISEYQLKDLFQDCEVGAVPAMGGAYQMEMILDESLLETENVYIEAGDHQHLLEMDHDDYSRVTKECDSGDISGPLPPHMPDRHGRWKDFM